MVSQAGSSMKLMKLIRWNKCYRTKKIKTMQLLQPTHWHLNYYQVNSCHPPAFNGRGSWFAYEELIYDWIDITTLDVPKQGPALRNRLTDEAAIYKSILNRVRLKTPAGVRYLITTLRPEFIKGVQHIFLYRLIQFFNQRRQNLDIHRWIAKYEIQKRRLLEAWMDLIPELTTEHTLWPTFNAKVEDYCRRKEKDVPEDAEERAIIVNEIQKAEHVDKFPFSDNLLTLMFIIFSQLQDNQRLLLTTRMRNC